MLGAPQRFTASIHFLFLEVSPKQPLDGSLALPDLSRRQRLMGAGAAVAGAVGRDTWSTGTFNSG